MLEVPSQNPAFRRWITAWFHRLYYGSGVWKRTRWMGAPVLKCPLDLWVYQEILAEVKPDVIIETGTYAGGSALYLAGLCELLGRGRVLSIDLEPQPNLPRHARIRYLTGSSVDPAVAAEVKRQIAPRESVLAILDSDHKRAHVLEEMKLYAELVTPGSYLIVEDTNLNGHPVRPVPGGGPMEAVQAFLKTHGGVFAPDTSREKFYLTFNPRGFLKKTRT